LSQPCACLSGKPIASQKSIAFAEFLEFIEGKKLPAIEILERRAN